MALFLKSIVIIQINLELSQFRQYFRQIALGLW
jgi:hypothetical protein